VQRRKKQLLLLRQLLLLLLLKLHQLQLLLLKPHRLLLKLLLLLLLKPPSSNLVESKDSLGLFDRRWASFQARPFFLPKPLPKCCIRIGLLSDIAPSTK
jgi:hypothetical protein